MCASTAIAYAEDQYPATNFQPTIVYQDEAYIAKDSQSAAAPSASTHASADDKYPAANFQPQVVYNDPSYKHAPLVVSAESAATTSASVSDGSAKPADSTTSYWVGLLVMALGGVAFFKSRQCGKCTKKASDAPTNSGVTGGVTGVARYLSKKSGTGVSRYLDKHMQNVKASASQAATGVEKYIRNRR